MKKYLLLLLVLFTMAQPIRADTYSIDSSVVTATIGFTNNPDLSANKKPEAESFAESVVIDKKIATLPATGERTQVKIFGVIFVLLSLYLLILKYLTIFRERKIL
ncbi:MULTISPECIES: hypothetical protein [Lactococcus]|uniref:Gram-positive cocci surface proteins LPxTG domain-containing protein n=1 Tax=Lactococcus petauri TaxID=1940789 RepID=A0ABZ2SE25_9LACT|nr:MULTISPECIES: hypothetical protein [Lactococcus]KKF90697.1 hypothetical protein YA68_07095 [Lactococcus garvieae]MCI3871608.1 hypothetical protein [Lactococcus petauri]MCQ8275867.1 hypothetical protein [Lactococcus petauri]MCR6589540.1 hypothetical protein [Lactococcus petauri]MCU7364045.1 hypothetical protein [Lactococcus petauri]